jgi:hypothetical protein
MLLGSLSLETFMQTSRFQLGLIATLAVGLGFSLSLSDAIGYPASAVSLGTNPVWSVGGTPSSTEILTAPADQDMIITDVHFANTDGSWLRLEMHTSGTYVAGFSSDDTSDRTVASLRSGIRVPAGQALTMNFEAHYGLGSSRYTVSGYYAQP